MASQSRHTLLTFGILIFATASAQRCDNEFRTINGLCTNPRFPTLGEAGTAIGSIFPRSSNTPSGRGLPSPRFISNTVSTQDGDTRNDRGLNELVTFFGQFIDHTCVITPLGSERMDIPIPADDPIFANFSGQLEFRRSQTVPVTSGRGRGRRRGRRLRRAVNELTAAMDLDSVYGAEDERAEALRSGVDGKLKTSAGNLLPLNTEGLKNAPSTSADFFVAGDERSNENPILTALHILFLREHNTICEELKDNFPDMDDEELYEMARRINIAQFQKIVFDEYFPAMTGRRLPPYRGFRPGVDVSVLNEFSTAGFRVGHTLIGNVINRRGPGNALLPSLPMDQMFFRTSSFIQDNTFEELIRGASQFSAQEIDLKVHDSIRNFLFTGIAGEVGFDLIALNLQRSRDHSLRSYNDIREELGQGRAGSFADISSNVNSQSALSTAYEGDVNDVEAWVGMMAEDHAPGSSFGPTLLALWQRQFLAFRDGDSFFFLNDRLPSEIREAIPRVDRLDKERDTFRKLIIRNSDITTGELPRRIFFL